MKLNFKNFVYDFLLFISIIKIQDKLNIKSYECGKIANQSRNYTIGQLEESLEHVLEMDIKQKTSSYDEKLGLEILIINLVYSI